MDSSFLMLASKKLIPKKSGLGVQSPQNLSEKKRKKNTYYFTVNKYFI